MKKYRGGFALLAGLVTVVSLNKSFAGCGQSIPTITNLPASDAYSYQVNGLNAGGELAGFFNANGSSDSHAFLYNGQVLDLGTLGGSISEGLAINTLGQVVGDSQLSLQGPSSDAIFFDGTNMVDLGTLGGSFSSANAINDAGQIVGSSLTTDFAFDAFLYANGTMSNLGDFGGGYSDAFAINSNGIVVGESANTNGDIHGFVYANGAMLDVGTFGGNYSSAFWVNNSGVVGGEAATANNETHGFVLSGSGLQDVGTFGGTFSSVSKVNDAGQAIGVATTSNDAETHGFIFSGGTLLDLGTFGGVRTFASDINNLGQIVGSSEGTDGNPRAFLWRNGTLTDLNDLVPGSGWLLQNASFINDAGRIVGQGTLNGVYQNFILDLASPNHAPTAFAGPDQTVECQVLVTLNGSGSSDPDGDVLAYEWSTGGNVLGTNAILSGYFALGTNVVTLKVSDPCGASSAATVAVIVKDTTAPTVAAPSQIEVAAGAGCQAAVPNVSSLLTVGDNCTPQAELQISQSPSAGALVSVGDYPIQATVTDLSGNIGSATIVFHVVDKTSPVISGATVNPSVLSPPNHQMVPVKVSVAATDNCDSAPISKIVSITCNEPVQAGEMTITGPLTASLAATRNGANGGRIYTLTIQCTDSSGNSSQSTVTVTVPQGKK